MPKPGTENEAVLAEAKAAAERATAELVAETKSREIALLDADLDLAVEDGRLTPAEKPNQRAFGLALIEADPLRRVQVELAAADGKPAKQSAFYGFRALLKARPKLDVFGEKAAGGEDKKGGGRAAELAAAAEAAYDATPALQKVQTAAVFVEGQLLAAHVAREEAKAAAGEVEKRRAATQKK